MPEVDTCLGQGANAQVVTRGRKRHPPGVDVNSLVRNRLLRASRIVENAHTFEIAQSSFNCVGRHMGGIGCWEVLVVCHSAA